MKKLKFIESSLPCLSKEEQNSILGGNWSCKDYAIVQCLAHHTCGTYTSFPGGTICSKKTWTTENDFIISVKPVTPNIYSCISKN